MIRINLLPEIKRRVPKRRAKAKVSRRLPVAWILVGLIALLLAGAGVFYVHMGTQGKLEAKRAEIDRINAEIKKYEQEKIKVQEATEMKKSLDRKKEVLSDLVSRRSGPVTLMDELEKAIPSTKLWFKEVLNTGNSLVISGYAVDGTEIGNFINNLQGSSFFTAVKFIESIMDKAGGGRQQTALEVKNFTIHASVRL